MNWKKENKEALIILFGKVWNGEREGRNVVINYNLKNKRKI